MFKSHTSRRFSVNINSCKLDSLEYESSKHINILRSIFLQNKVHSACCRTGGFKPFTVVVEQLH